MTQTQPFRTESRTFSWASPGQADLGSLLELDGLGQLLHPGLAERTLTEPVEYLVLDGGEVVLAPQLVLQSGLHGRVGGVQRTPGADRIRWSLYVRHGAHFIESMLENQC